MLTFICYVKKVLEVEFFIFLRDIAKKSICKYLKSYDQKQELKHILYLDANRYAISKFLSTATFKWIDPKEFDLDNYTSYSSKGCEYPDFEYPE